MNETRFLNARHLPACRDTREKKKPREAPEEAERFAEAMQQPYPVDAWREAAAQVTRPGLWRAPDGREFFAEPADATVVPGRRVLARVRFDLAHQAAALDGVLRRLLAPLVADGVVATAQLGVEHRLRKLARECSPEEDPELLAPALCCPGVVQHVRMIRQRPDTPLADKCHGCAAALAHAVATHLMDRLRLVLATGPPADRLALLRREVRAVVLRGGGTEGMCRSLPLLGDEAPVPLVWVDADTPPRTVAGEPAPTVAGGLPPGIDELKELHARAGEVLGRWASARAPQSQPQSQPQSLPQSRPQSKRPRPEPAGRGEPPPHRRPSPHLRQGNASVL